jgi:hypothetical protein
MCQMSIADASSVLAVRSAAAKAIVTYYNITVQGPIGLLPDTCAGRVTRGVQVRSRKERTRSSVLEAAVAAEVGMHRREKIWRVQVGLHGGPGWVTRGGDRTLPFPSHAA